MQLYLPYYFGPKYYESYYEYIFMKSHSPFSVCVIDGMSPATTVQVKGKPYKVNGLHEQKLVGNFAPFLSFCVGVLLVTKQQDESKKLGIHKPKYVVFCTYTYIPNLEN